jgi:filamentous hemagglutinin family protein
MLFGIPVQIAMANPNPPPNALPTGGVVVGGSVGDVDIIPGVQLDLMDVTNGTIINWQNFDIGASATVNFDQVSSSAAVLNRVNAIDGMATGIFGTLNANGTVFIVNPLGIVFGPSAFIKASQLVASGMNISNADFLDYAINGEQLRLGGVGGSGGNVINWGEIQARCSILVGRNVFNFGTITKREQDEKAYVVMGAGDQIYFGWQGSNIVVEKLATQNPDDHLVSNQGTIATNGGKILFAAGDIFSNALGDVDSLAAVLELDDLTAVATGDVHLNEVKATGAVKVQSGRKDDPLCIECGPTYEGGGSIYLDDDVEGASIALKAGSRRDYDSSWSQIFLADGKTLTSTSGSIGMEAIHDVVLGGAVDAATNLYINADRQGNDGHEHGGDVWAKDDLIAGGSADIYGNALRFEGDVRANGGDLSLTGRTSSDSQGQTLFDSQSAWGNIEVGPGGTLYASGNLSVTNANPGSGVMKLTGEQSLSLIAGGTISTADTEIGVTGSSLLMQQGASLDTADYAFFNQADTDLTLISDSGSVISDNAKVENAADKWKSIGAQANNDDGGAHAIRLLGDGHITTTKVKATNDDILIKSNQLDILATDVIEADNGNVVVNAGDNLTLQARVFAKDNMALIADGDDLGLGDVVAQELTTENGNMLIVGRNVTLQDTASSGNNMTIVARPDVGFGGGDVHAQALNAGGTVDISASDSTINLHDNVVAGVDIRLRNNTVADDEVMLDASQDVILEFTKTLSGEGALTVEAGRDIKLGGDVEASVLTAGDLILDAGGDMIALGNITVHDGSLNVHSSDSTTYLGGDWVEASDDITLHNNTELIGGDQRIEAVSGQLYANGSVHKGTSGDLEMIGGYNGPLGTVPYDYSVWTQDVTVDDGELTIRGNAAVRLDGSIYSSGNMKLAANDDGIDSGDLEYLIHYHGTIESRDGYVDLSAQGDVIYLDALNAGDYVTAGDDILIRDYTWVQYDSTLVAGDDVVLASGENIQANGSLTLEAADDIILGVDDVDNHWVAPQNGSAGDVTARGDLILDAGDDVYAHGDLESTEGSVEVYSSDSTTHLWGNVTGAVDVLLNNNTRFLGGDQTVEAVSGTLTAHGWLRKITSGDLWLLGGWDSSDDEPAVDLTYVSAGPWDPAVSTCLGNLWIIGEGDVQISGDLTTFGPCLWCCAGPETTDVFIGTSYCRPTGGVGIVSNEGKIYTEDGLDNDTLNVSVTGNSDHWAGLGVDLPEGDGKAAILISSKEDLKIGEDARLAAYGKYYDDVDDRAGIGFLDAPAEIPGGIPRDEGDAFDLAIYAASQTGDVDVSSPVTIMSRVDPAPVPLQEVERPRPPLCVFEPKGAMVIDAYDTVTFGADFETSLAAGAVGDRLEVVSRITEWLFQAVTMGTLPYAGGGGPFPPGYTYVLRGAGLGNPAITDGRAWVLQNPSDPAPLYTEAGDRAEEQEFGEGGCPALMEWFAGEVGVPAEDIRIYVANAFASATDLQPCEACARLRDSAMVLADAEDTYIAALAQVVNEFVTTPAPPSEEQMTSIATAFADHTGDGTHYAAAGQWIDALSQYVSILTAELGYAADESAGFADKYVGGVRDMGNESVTAYVEARLAALGG